MRIPTTAAADVQEAFRTLEARIKILEAAAGNHNLAGQRLINAGDAVQPTDYVTLRQLQDTSAAAAQNGDFQTLLVHQIARVIGALFLPALTDGSKHHGIVYVDEAGQIQVNTDGGNAFDLNLTDNLLELGFDMRIQWIAHLASIGSPADGIINVLDDAGTSFLRFVLGPDSATGIALRKNGTTLEIRVGGGGGALTDLVCKTLTANNVPVSGGTAAFAVVVVGTDPGGVDLLRVGGNATFGGDTNAHRVDGTSFRVNGHAGVDFGPGPIASITIEKGIVTAAS